MIVWESPLCFKCERVGNVYLYPVWMFNTPFAFLVHLVFNHILNRVD